MCAYICQERSEIRMGCSGEAQGPGCRWCSDLHEDECEQAYFVSPWHLAGEYASLCFWHTAGVCKAVRMKCLTQKMLKALFAQIVWVLGQ